MTFFLDGPEQLKARLVFGSCQEQWTLARDKHIMIKTLTKIAVDWGNRCFGIDHMRNEQIRALRFAEEALELAQVCGVSEAKAIELIRVVFSRPVGRHLQEVGGTMVTLAVLCDTLGIDMEEAFQIEVRRCLDKDPAHFAKRNQEKIGLGLD